MTRLSRLRRTVALAGVALQLALPVASTLADARLEAATERFRVHVEAPSTSDFQRLHADDCALCQYLSTAPTAAERATITLADRVTIRVTPVEEHRPTASAGRLVPPARGPPTV